MSSKIYFNPDAPLNAENIAEGLASSILSVAFTNDSGSDVFGTSIDMSGDTALRMEMTDGSQFEISVKKMTR
jgi:hypothetical protein